MSVLEKQMHIHANDKLRVIESLHGDLHFESSIY